MMVKRFTSMNLVFIAVEKAFEDILTSLKEQRERDECVTISRRDLMSQLFNVANTTKKDFCGLKSKNFQGGKIVKQR